ncbi:hypothetical protein BAUCODRAFT_116646 [Baudoinia panamericana UAMH 10762]|uniref:Rhodopsin domain-containing protein n=1 Tax=Baudoinia panamericana (strain UAMH 10762) TaxID=717646 RepID=M2LCM0_BAUPA|nr:uncharacterized protein BAUCODRAFT_116646 [Baudoinia panamericana UAMH 10762]EMC91707.1 hypothetical protein BAUCODRAFT_116646 [Baudoinia panamericana UAMH 10762]
MPAFGVNLPTAYVIIVALTLIVWTLLALAIRLFIRFGISEPWGHDDSACVLATVFGSLYSSLTLLEIRYGLGEHSSGLNPDIIGWSQFLLWFTNMLYATSHELAILSVCYFILRLCGPTNKVWTPRCIAIVTYLWLLAAVFAFAFQCRLPTPWNLTRPRLCINLVSGAEGTRCFRG